MGIFDHFNNLLRHILKLQIMNPRKNMIDFYLINYKAVKKVQNRTGQY